MRIEKKFPTSGAAPHGGACYGEVVVGDSVPAPAGEAPDVKALLEELKARALRLQSEVSLSATPTNGEAHFAQAGRANGIYEAVREIEAALGASGAPGRDAPSEPSGAAIEAAYAVSERREGEPRTEPLVRALRAAYAVDFGASRGLPAAPPEEPTLREEIGKALRALDAQAITTARFVERARTALGEGRPE